MQGTDSTQVSLGVGDRVVLSEVPKASEDSQENGHRGALPSTWSCVRALSREGLLPQNVFLLQLEYLKCIPGRHVDSSLFSSHLSDDTLTLRGHI